MTVTNTHRGKVPRRKPKLSSAELEKRQAAREAKIIEMAARRRVQFSLESVNRIPKEIRGAIEEVTGKDFETFVDDVKAAVKTRAEGEIIEVGGSETGASARIEDGR